MLRIVGWECVGQTALVVRICTLGDLLLDVVALLDGPIARDTDTYARTRVGPGGQAANVAAWVSALGGHGRFVGMRGDDLAGRLVDEALRERGVEVLGPLVRAATGTVVSLAGPNGQRSMISDRGVSPQLRPDELQPDWFSGCEWLHVSGYSLARSPLREAALAAAQLARDGGAAISLDVASTTAIDELGRGGFLRACADLDPSLAFATEAELDAIGGLDVETLVLKRGARGFAVRVAGKETSYEAASATVVDATGAGDALAAGYLLRGPELALAAAARCVSTVGAMPERPQVAIRGLT
jgi:sugar/nucleoside kinase (ribokinase family)